MVVIALFVFSFIAVATLSADETQKIKGTVMSINADTGEMVIKDDAGEMNWCCGGGGGLIAAAEDKFELRMQGGLPKVQQIREDLGKVGPVIAENGCLIRFPGNNHDVTGHTVFTHHQQG